MTKILVIPDVHLKPFIFERAAQLMRENVADRAVSLGDLADDHRKKKNISLYAETYDAAISFAKEFPETLWCYGNHDYSYLANQLHSGYSHFAHNTVVRKENELTEAMPDKSHYAFIHRIDDVLFLHAGLCDYFAKTYCTASAYRNPNKLIDEINRLEPSDLWTNYSPIWFRPQYSKEKMYKPKKLLQVVGHTPMECPTREKNVLSCDVFLKLENGKPYGSEEFTVVDTETWDFACMK